ncbi:MAG: hypothetical protein HZB30_10260 [Nitrospirae bacterium]|nr:hypothetical protein [Nitrospirota bacterium]
MISKFFYIVICITSILSTIPQFAYSLSVETHEALNERISKGAWNGFSLDNYLKSNLALNNGVNTNLNNNKIYDWIKLGGRYEDRPPNYISYIRSVNHFHDPLATSLSTAGFSGIWDTGFLSGISSVEWSQWPLGAQTIQVLGSGNYSWYDVRDYFYKALTSTDKTTRDNNFADIFRGLGQAMHLVEDMSVPEHARNDGHYSDAYEEYVRAHPSLVDSATASPIFFSMAALIQPSVYGTAAPVPIANLFDTNQYDGTNISVTYNQNIGLAEYANANFFSPDTIFKNYPHPAKVNTTAAQVEQYARDGKRDTVYYIQGYTSQRLAAYSYLNKWLLFDQWKYNLDDFVYEDYASQLLPRAVGYSAGLLNYFFRGNIELTIPSTGIYAQTDNATTGFTRITLLAKNITPGTEEMTSGSIELVVRYKLAHDDPFQSNPVATDTEFTYVTVPESNNVNSIPRGSATVLTFGTGQSTIIPLWTTDVYLQVVFKGRLGNEDGAIAVGLKDISEPTPVDLFNNMDKICLFGS